MSTTTAGAAVALRGETLRALGAPDEGVWHVFPTVTVIVGADAAAMAADVDTDPEDWLAAVRTLGGAGYGSIGEPAWDARNGLWAWLLGPEAQFRPMGAEVSGLPSLARLSPITPPVLATLRTGGFYFPGTFPSSLDPSLHAGTIELVSEKSHHCDSGGGHVPSQPDPVPEEEEDYRSYSQLSTWLKCPRQFQLEKLARIPRRPGWWFPGGTAVHAAIESYLRQTLEAKEES